MTTRIMGVDCGEKRVGLSLSDPLGITAQPLDYILRDTDAQVADEIKELIEAHEVERLIVGLPLNMSGGDTPQTKRVRRFISRLRKLLDIKVESLDERLSTAEAERALIDMDVRRNRRKERRDIVAAQLILQGYLDMKSISGSPLS
ncbi:MAG: Holliday junction resolvase RuvX [Nitrospinaceae bacterium]|jgi:putative holliday junction resolvase|nr:Holliday junction resolvase RuvX [Nitrospinaceae bacterium]MBT3434576.1 Holliday junction resolvase RuvX [Nitrospinaceae bacterium]MBT3822827.1 Holliday junction resolvase RuvX [Nitrospinaceae bacterium]MBT4432619.1 Holliday junction resolvase RuvX [Nitrospinaceae bacterium]MBT5367062.1 Holliday junction resolvase RuvX [Nitrospinaceae bacterium]